MDSDRDWLLGGCGRVVCCLALALLVQGCALGRIGLDQVDPTTEYQLSTRSALTGNQLSNSTRTTLRRQGLLGTCELDAPRCLSGLHAEYVSGATTSDHLFALAELSFLYAERRTRAQQSPEFRSGATKLGGRGPLGPVPHDAETRSRYLAAAVYAYAFLFPESEDDQITFLDQRTRVAADLYARGIAEGFSNTQPGGMFVASGRYRLPFGNLDVEFDEDERKWGSRLMGDFRWVGAFEPAGLNNRYRQAGIGVAVAARTTIGEGQFDFVSKSAWVPATILLRMDRPRSQIASEQINARFEIYAAHEDPSFSIDDRHLALETDRTTALAASLEQSRFWENNLARFLGQAVRIDRRALLFSQDPYVPGEIPVVFVHGTDSNPSTWANMVNDLQHDPRIRKRFHFWYFQYDSGNPILYSSMLLRRSMREAVHHFRTAEGPGCLDDMIVIGHSQGGLLTKLTSVDSGSAFWDAWFSKPFDQMTMRPETRALLGEAVFVESLDFVNRLVFISTPHRGSFLASSQFVRRLASRFIKLPRELLQLSADVARLRRYLRFTSTHASTSIDNMSPGDPFIQTLSRLSVVPGVHQHSIISLREGESKETGSDGVVKYSSAHIDGVDSELIVRSGHSTLANPHTVEEVRRILLLHAGTSTCGSPSQGDMWAN